MVLPCFINLLIVIIKPLDPGRKLHVHTIDEPMTLKDMSSLRAFKRLKATNASLVPEVRTSVRVLPL